MAQRSGSRFFSVGTTYALGATGLDARTAAAATSSWTERVCARKTKQNKKKKKKRKEKKTRG
jgi:hypothetical protein